MREFTKGTWEDFFGGEIIGADRKILIAHTASLKRYYDKENRHLAIAERSANARLIAAAPDMYDELYEALQLLKGKSSYDGDEFAIQAKSIQELLNRIDGKADS